VPELAPLNRDQTWSQFTVWTPVPIPPHSENNSAMKHKARSANTEYQKTHKRALPRLTVSKW